MHGFFETIPKKIKRIQKKKRKYLRFLSKNVNVIKNKKNNGKIDNIIQTNKNTDKTWKISKVPMSNRHKKITRKSRRFTRTSHMNGWKRGQIYGQGMHVPNLAPKLINLHNVGTDKNVMRKVASNHDTAISTVFNELQRQNRLESVRNNEGFYRQRKNPWFGPRFITQTRIGKLHHNNVNTRLFKYIDDDA